MSPRFILAVTDFSSHGDNALARAARLSAEHGAALKLACIRRHGETAPADAVIRLAQHAQQLSQAHGIPVQAAHRRHRSLEDLRPEVMAADLVVWGAAPRRGLGAFFLGQPVEALMRSAGRPVLVVRQGAQHPYRHLLVAVDFTEASPALTAFSLAFTRAASVELFHAVSTANEGKLLYAEVSPSAILAYRAQCRRHARKHLSWLIESAEAADSEGQRVQSTIAHGDPAFQALVQQAHSGADLIVVGKHPRWSLSELFFGSVAGRLLRHSQADRARTDVLVVPHGCEPARRSTAAHRLAAVRPAPNRARAGEQRERAPSDAAAAPGARFT